MTNHISAELSAFLDGRLPDDATRRIAAHLDGCTRCRREADDFRALKTGLAGMERHAAPPSLMRTLNHAFLDAPRPAARWWTSLLAPFAWKPVGAFAAVVVVTAGLLALHISTRDEAMDVAPLMAAHMRYQAESLVPNSDPTHANLSAQLVNYNAQED